MYPSTYAHLDRTFELPTATTDSTGRARLCLRRYWVPRGTRKIPVGTQPTGREGRSAGRAWSPRRA